MNPQALDPARFPPALSTGAACEADRMLAEADAVIARLLSLTLPDAASAQARPDLQEHLAAAWFRKLGALRDLGRQAEAGAAADALIQHFDPADPQVWPWLARAACDKALILSGQNGVGPVNQVDEALDILGAVQRRFAATDALPVREWLAFAGLHEARLRAGRGATFARVDMVRQCQELADRFGGDDWTPTRAVVGRIRLARAALLSQLDYDRDALDGYTDLHAELRTSTEAPLMEVAADALHARARLLKTLGRHDEAMATLDLLVAEYRSAPDTGVRRTLALAQADRVLWFVRDAEQGGDDPAQADQHDQHDRREDRVIAACDALLAEHSSSTDTPVCLCVNQTMRHQANALRDRAAQRDGEHAAADYAQAQRVTDAQWAAHADHTDARIQQEVMQAMLDQLASLDAPDIELAGYGRVLARFGDMQTPQLQPLIARALQLKAWAQRALGQPDDALNTLDVLQARFGQSDDPGVQWPVLASGLERARILMQDRRYAEALTTLVALERFADTPHDGLRMMVARAMDMQVDVWAAQTPPPPACADDQQSPSMTTAEENQASAVCALAARFAADADAGVRRLVADACYTLAVNQRERQHFGAALQTYDLYLRYFEPDMTPAIQERTASAWLNKAYLLLELLDRPADALPVYDQIVARFTHATSPSMRDTLARAAASRLTCLNRLQREGVAVNYGDQYEDLPLDKRDAIGATISGGNAHADDSRYREAIACYDEVLNAHVESLHPELRRLCLDAMVRKVYCLGRLAQREAALALSNELIARYGAELSTSFEKDVALAMVYKSVQLDRLGRHDEEIEVYRDIISRWADSTVPALRKQVATARYSLAITVADTDVNAALALYEEVMDTCLDAPETMLRLEGAKSAVNRAFRLRSLGRHEEAVACGEELLSACADDTDAAIAAQVTNMRIGLARSYAALGNTQAQLAMLEALLTLPDSAITAAQRAAARTEHAALKPGAAPITKAARMLGAWLGKRKS